MAWTDVVSNVKVYGLEESIQASKYPKAVDVESCDSTITDTVRNLAACPTGTGHDQFLTGIVVQFDLTFSIKAWVEAERYHFLDFVSSQSTMHRILSFDVEKQCNEYVVTGGILQSLIDLYHDNPTPENYLRVLYNVPVGFCLTARMTTNYRQLKTIYQQRRTHRLPEWREFCKWVETLPQAELITKTIEVEPVRHGRWVVDDLGHTYCSECGKRIPFFHCYSEEPCSDYDEEWDEEISETRNCPNCGAKMDGGVTNE